MLAFARFLERIGAPVERFASDVHLPHEMLHDPELLVPLHLGGVFAQTAARREGLEDLGFRASEASPLASMGAFGVLVSRARTLGEALEVWARARAIFNSGARIRLSLDRERAWIHWSLDPRIRAGRREAEQFWAIKALQLVRALPGAAELPLELRLRSAPIPGLREPALFAHVDVRFCQLASALAFPRALLLQRPPLAEAPSAARVELERALFISRPAADFASSVSQVALGHPTTGYLDLRAVSDAIGVSMRTLQRRLSESGQSYSAMIDHARSVRALELVRRSELSITDVAFAVGYSDLANFTHAFRRWTGVSPREFRRRAAAPSRQALGSAAEPDALP